MARQEVKLPEQDSPLPWGRISQEYSAYIARHPGMDDDLSFSVQGKSRRVLQVTFGTSLSEIGAPERQIYIADKEDPYLHMTADLDDRRVLEYTFVRRRKEGASHPDLQLRDFVRGTYFSFRTSGIEPQAVKAQWRNSPLYDGIYQQFVQLQGQGKSGVEAAILTSDGRVYAELGFMVKPEAIIPIQGHDAGVTVYFTRS